MLQNLTVKNLALISFLSCDFERGFQVLTGETGAGKSLVLDSLNLFLSTGGTKSLVRRGEKELEVTLLFTDLSDKARAAVAESGIEAEDDLVLCRKVSDEGKSRSFINGAPVSGAQMRAVAAALFAINGQNAAMGLIDEKNHLSYVDATLSEEGKRCREDYRALYRDYSEKKRELDEILADKRDPKELIALYDYQLSEIRAAAPKKGEDEELEKKLQKIQASEKLFAALTAADRALSGGEKGRGAAFLTGYAAAKLSALTGFPSYAAAAEKLENIAAELTQLAREVSGELADIDDGEDREALEKRIDTLYRLKQKYGPELADVFAYYEKIKTQKRLLSDREYVIREKTRELETIKKRLLEKGGELSDNRRDCGAMIEEKVAAILAFLDMKKTRVFVRVLPLEEPRESGTDRVLFTLVSNVGEGEKPLSRIASGGELARILLALELSCGAAAQTDTAVFDEVDTGISGATSQKIGLCLKKLAEKKQVFCVTHSAQVASLADCHYKVEKKETDGRTETGVRLLSESESETELARILGGADPEKTARQNAAALIIEGKTEYEKMKNTPLFGL